MILQHIASGIRNQDWFVVVIEVLVVIVSIFLALQVDDWSENQKEKRDEQRFLVQLHQDIVNAEELSARVEARRLERVSFLIDATDVMFGRGQRDELTNQECISIGSSNYFNINVSRLPAYAELASTGRLGIIQNKELRTALLELQQAQEALSALILIQTIGSAGAILSARYPDLITLDAYFDSERGEVRSTFSCDLAKMQANRAFLNEFSIAVDRYDAYIRDGLAPWSAQFHKVHEMVDRELDFEH